MFLCKRDCLYFLLLESKWDAKKNLKLINELADIHNCTMCLYFEMRRHDELYMWLSKTPNGPSIKMLVLNVHTMEELRMTGNHLKGSRPLLSFDSSFDQVPYLKLIKEMLMLIFNAPKGHPKSKPFFDHIFSFSLIDNRIWFRNYQILEEGQSSKNSSSFTLIEVGPRLTLWPVRIFSHSFGGSTLYLDSKFISVQLRRRQSQEEKGQDYAHRFVSKLERKDRRKDLALIDDELDHVFDA
jgi:ribosome biogenesis protein BRX1